MGICGKEEDPTKQDLKNIVVPNNDFSFIYTVLLALYNLNTFKNFILKEKSQNEIKIGESLKKIFTKYIIKDPIKSSKIIYYRIKNNNYNNNIELYPEKILIKILELLNQEQRSKKDIDNTQILTNIQNKYILNYNNSEEEAFYSHLKIFITNKNNNKIGDLFFMFFQKRITNCFQIINFSYEHKFVFELNLFYIFQKKSTTGILSYNNSQIPELDLNECILENTSPHYTCNNFNQCIEQTLLYSIPAYLIIILNRRGNDNNYFNGHFRYNKTIDLSSVILRKDSAKYYKLSSVIKEKRDLSSIIDKKCKNEYNFNYITINLDSNGDYYYYENNKKILKMFDKNGYYTHILIFRQEKREN